MKTAAAFAILGILATALPAARADDMVNLDLSICRRELAPYGRWIDTDAYGRAWQPYEAVSHRGWRPYCDGGRWRWTDEGWYWHSTYRWGAIPFHYGRWTCLPRAGWVWVPHHAWAPAWVHWRYSDRAVGWAPLPPGATYHSSAGFSFNGRSVGLNFSFGLSESDYTFIPREDIFSTSVADVILSSSSFHFRFSRIAARDYRCGPRVRCPGIPYDVIRPRRRPATVYIAPPRVVYPRPYCPPVEPRRFVHYRDRHRHVIDQPVVAPRWAPVPAPAPAPAPRRPSQDRVVVRHFKSGSSGSAPAPAPAPRISAPAPRAAPAPAPAPVVRRRSSGSSGRAGRLSEIVRNRMRR
jgi:hypothetical protein